MLFVIRLRLQYPYLGDAYPRNVCHTVARRHSRQQSHIRLQSPGSRVAQHRSSCFATIGVMDTKVQEGGLPPTCSCPQTVLQEILLSEKRVINSQTRHFAELSGSAVARSFLLAHSHMSAQQLLRTVYHVTIDYL